MWKSSLHFEKEMHFEYILFMILIARLYAQQELFSGIIFGHVDSISETFITKYHVSFRECQENCVDRLKCLSFDYHTLRPHECLLHSGVVSRADLVRRPGWVFQARSDISIVSPCQGCNTDQTCDRTTNTCTYKECGVIKSSADFIRLGHGNNVGSTAVLACPPGKFPESLGEIGTWPVRRNCEGNGKWTPQGLFCTNYAAVCHNYIFGPDTGTTMSHWSNYVIYDVTLVSGPCGVPDDKMTASSATYPPYDAKDLTIPKTWVSAPGDNEPYIQVEFGQLTEVKGIRTRGRNPRDPNDPNIVYHEYPTHYKVSYSSDCTQGSFSSFARSIDGGEIFVGNTDSTSIVERIFETPISALCVRVNIMEFVSTYPIKYLGMKLELLGTVKLPVL